MEVSGQPCKQRTQVTRHNNFDSKIMHLPFAYPMPGTPSPPKKINTQNYYSELSSCAANAHCYIIKGEQDQVELLNMFKEEWRGPNCCNMPPPVREGAERGLAQPGQRRKSTKSPFHRTLDCLNFSSCGKRGSRIGRTKKN